MNPGRNSFLTRSEAQELLTEIERERQRRGSYMGEALEAWVVDARQVEEKVRSSPILQRAMTPCSRSFLVNTDAETMARWIENWLDQRPGDLRPSRIELDEPIKVALGRTEVQQDQSGYRWKTWAPYVFILEVRPGDWRYLLGGRAITAQVWPLAPGRAECSLTWGEAFMPLVENLFREIAIRWPEVEAPGEEVGPPSQELHPLQEEYRRLLAEYQGETRRPTLEEFAQHKAMSRSTLKRLLKAQRLNWRTDFAYLSPSPDA